MTHLGTVDLPESDGHAAPYHGTNGSSYEGAVGELLDVVSQEILAAAGKSAVLGPLEENDADADNEELTDANTDADDIADRLADTL